jgi:hypothetical protein
MDRQGGRASNSAIATLEREGKRLVARLLTFVGFDELSAFRSLLNDHLPSFGRVMQFATSENARDMTFQWKAIREMCAGCTSFLSHKGDLRRQLRIPKKQWRSPGPLSCPHLYFSKHLSDSAVKAACFPEMAALLPFDREAFDWIPIGWEMKEFHDRSRERERRLVLLARLTKEKAENSAGVEDETHKHLGRWQQQAESRTRRWRGWW